MSTHFRWRSAADNRISAPRLALVSPPRDQPGKLSGEVLILTNSPFRKYSGQPNVLDNLKRENDSSQEVEVTGSDGTQANYDSPALEVGMA